MNAGGRSKLLLVARWCRSRGRRRRDRRDADQPGRDAAQSLRLHQPAPDQIIRRIEGPAFDPVGHDPVRLRQAQAGVAGQVRRGYVVEVDQPAVVESAYEVRAADAEVERPDGVDRGELSRLLRSPDRPHNSPTTSRRSSAPEYSPLSKSATERQEVPSRQQLTPLALGDDLQIGLARRV